MLYVYLLDSSFLCLMLEDVSVDSSSILMGSSWSKAGPTQRHWRTPRTPAKSSLAVAQCFLWLVSWCFWLICLEMANPRVAIVGVVASMGELHRICNFHSAKPRSTVVSAGLLSFSLHKRWSTDCTTASPLPWRSTRSTNSWSSRLQSERAKSWWPQCEQIRKTWTSLFYS